MNKLVMIDEILIQFMIDKNSTKSQVRRIRRTLLRGRLLERIRTTMQQILQRHPTLVGVQIAVSR